MDAPKLFISYSWSSPEHQAWVRKLAEELAADGIHVILDKWDLKEGHDANAFMERMVNDPTVGKVAIISDEVYANKANNRQGGVGTETQIISAEVYGAVDQNKFVVVLPTLDDGGNPFVPTYAKTRIYIDLSTPDRFAENYEQLVRWVYDKPMHKRPVLGKRPAFLDEDASVVSLGSRSVFRRAVESARAGREGAGGAIDDAFDQLIHVLPHFAINREEPVPGDEPVFGAIERMAGFRAQFETLITVLSRFADTEESGVRVHRFFEQFLPFYDARPVSGSYHPWDFDAYRFLGWELFLLAVGTALKLGAFAIVKELVARPYYNVAARHGEMAMLGFQALNREVESLDERDRRLGLNLLSLQADVAKDRSEAVHGDFRVIVQADLLLYLRNQAMPPGLSNWYPMTLIYGSRVPLEIFARCVSRKHLNRILTLIGGSEEAVREAVTYSEENRLFSRGYRQPPLRTLLGLDRWGEMA